MVKTRRSSHQCSPAKMDPKRRRTAIYSLNNNVNGIQDPLTSKEICFKLLQEVFLNSRKHWWYRCLPAEDEYEDIQQATGMEWAHLLPLLIYCGLITFRVDSMVKEGTVLVEQWEELAQAISRHVRLQITQIRSKRCGRIAFFCLDCPHYSSPTKQHKDTNLFLHNQSVMERQLAIDIKKFGENIKAIRLYNRVMENDNNLNQTLDNDEVIHVSNEIQDQIQYALALDLQRRPRLSRTNAGK